jgi:hypothetical protein
MTKTSEEKLDKCKIREKNLEGDCFLIAVSVSYLSAFSFKERNSFRKDLAEKMLTMGLEVSEFWLSDAENVHQKLFKKILSKDFGLKWIFNKLNHLFIDSNFAEFIFTLSVAPTLPIVFDSVGNFQDYLIEELISEAKGKVKLLFSADYMIEEKIQQALDQNLDEQIFLVNDVNDHTKQSMGKSQDSHLLNSLIRKDLQKVDAFKPIQMPKICFFSAFQHFNLSSQYLSRATIYNACFINKTEAWIEIKQILLKHFLPENYSSLSKVKENTLELKEKV